MEIELAAARLALSRLSSEEAVAAASSALDRGMVTESLCRVFYEQPGSPAAVPLFRKALADLGVPVPPVDQASLTLAREYARQTVSGAVSAYEGARRIWWELAHEPGSDISLWAFVGLASEWEDDPAHRPEYEAEILREAGTLLNGGAVGGSCGS